MAQAQLQTMAPQLTPTNNQAYLIKNVHLVVKVEGKARVLVPNWAVFKHHN